MLARRDVRPQSPQPPAELATGERVGDEDDQRSGAESGREAGEERVAEFDDHVIIT